MATSLRIPVFSTIKPPACRLTTTLWKQPKGNNWQMFVKCSRLGWRHVSSRPRDSSEAFRINSLSITSKVPFANSWCWHSGPLPQKDSQPHVHEFNFLIRLEIITENVTRSKRDQTMMTQRFNKAYKSPPLLAVIQQQLHPGYILFYCASPKGLWHHNIVTSPFLNKQTKWRDSRVGNRRKDKFHSMVLGQCIV